MFATEIAALVVIIIGICEAIKYAGMNTRWIPLIAVLLGIVGTLIIGTTGWLTILAGVMSGLAASGLYAGVFKTTILNQ